MFTFNNVGIVTARDNFTIHKTENDLINTIEDFLKLDDETARIKYDLGKDVRDWQVNFARKDLQDNYPNKGNITKISYRLFDDRYTFFTGKTKGFHCYPRNEIMKHFINGDNLGLLSVNRQPQNNPTSYYFLTKNIFSTGCIRSDSVGIDSVFPLYLYPETTNQKSLLEEVVRTPNLKMEIVNQISEKLGIPFVAEKSPSFGGVGEVFAPIDILDYIYAVLHSPSYREKYKEFLKIDFPRVPHPKDQKTFFDLVALGSELRQIHLLESEIVEKYITQYPEDGNNEVGKIHFEITDLKGFENSLALGNVHINESQYFANVPDVAWNFYIGGYQPAQKWLKDRKGRELGYEDILHYQKIIVALTQTDRLMKEIDKIEI